MYFEEIARLGFKRTLDLDQMIDAYFYTLKKLSNKEEALKKASEKIKKDKENTKEVSVKESSSTQFSSKEVTHTPITTSSEKTITQIIEEN